VGLLTAQASGLIAKVCYLERDM